MTIGIGIALGMGSAGWLYSPAAIETADDVLWSDASTVLWSDTSQVEW